MPRLRSARPLIAALTSGTLVAAVGVAVAAPSGAPSTGLQITTVSNRADLISGGDALVRVALPARVAPSGVRLDLDGRDVTRAFAVRRDRTFEGLVSGLKLGANTLTASAHGEKPVSLTITNHPLGGPVFAGPQIQPWTCQTGATDKQCDQKPTFSYFYVPVGTANLNFGEGGGTNPPTTFQSYDPANPPPAQSIASTTTTDGATVPFIVREETGYIDRDQYAIAALYQPGKPWAPTAPQKQFNGRLVITHGASCDTSYAAGSAPGVMDAKVLGAGFVVMSNALDNSGHACNLLVQAEALVMTKEYVVDHYGPVRWTIGSGCSGGSLVQQQVANAYPGIYQGITPQCSFTDAWSSSMEYSDYDALLKYFEDPSRWDPGTVWTPVQISSVIDHPNVANPLTFTTAIPNSGEPTRSCPGVATAKVYDEKTNPHGVRCTLQDYSVNAFGRRASDGFANRPSDNVGIQYGLQGLREGVISPAQFVDLNTNLGGFDIDYNLTKHRTAADPVGLKRVYTTGLVDSANNLDKVAIIDLRGPDPGAFHDVYRTYAMRARLLRNFGTAANQVLWRGQAPLIGDVNFADQSIFAMDSWLARVDADHRAVPLAVKIREDKPGEVADRCTNGAGTDLPSYICDETVAAYGTPRFAAGEPMTDDVMKCQLKPLRADDYTVKFTSQQWARLVKAFPNGVCDYSKPGVSQRGAIAWLTYQDASGHVIYGGTPMGAPPVSRPAA